MNLIFCALWVYSNSSVGMNVFMLRTFWIRPAGSRVKRCERDFGNALQSDHRYGGRRHGSAVAMVRDGWFLDRRGARDAGRQHFDCPCRELGFSHEWPDFKLRVA